MIEREDKTPEEAELNWYADILFDLAKGDLEREGIEPRNEAIKELVAKELQNTYRYDSIAQRAKLKRTVRINRIANSLKRGGEFLRKRELDAQKQILEEYKENDTAFRIIGDIILRKRHVEKS